MKEQAAAIAVLIVVGVGLATATFVGWQGGSAIIGLGLLLAAGLRLSLPARRAGLLVSRSKAFDGTVLLVLGFSLLALAGAIPEG
ncbi:MAG TPA: DUF3017 domain-containing protein [Mycobacteriales bacterium]|nr:DUF3017 domain-containing protein [Mycobacteriales bacterium]